eukprot:3244199-Rhodomonas_salina.2
MAADKNQTRLTWWRQQVPRPVRESWLPERQANQLDVDQASFDTYTGAEEPSVHSCPWGQVSIFRGQATSRDSV